MSDSNKKSRTEAAADPAVPERVNLGCGFGRLDGFCNVDSRPETKPDLVLDVTEGLPWPDSSVQEVRAHDFLEHVPADKVPFVIDEIWRVLAPGGVLDHFTPSTDGRGAFQDPYHRSFWNIRSWLYWMDDTYRGLYGHRAKFEGSNEDKFTYEPDRVIHTEGRLRAVKD